jgi:hypothetical protein
VEALSDKMLAILARDEDLRSNIRRIAATLDDLTRSRVVGLSDEDFAEYVSLTVPHAAAKLDTPAAREPSWNARMLQYGFLYAVAAIRDELANPGQSRRRLRVNRLRMLAHFHGMAAPIDRLDVRALKHQRVDINAPQLRPLVAHYLRSHIETLGSSGRPLVDELSIAASLLNAALSLAVMNADGNGKPVDRAILIQAITEASDVSHAPDALLGWALERLGGSTDALWHLSAGS